jgi:hypothetical protein
LIADNIVAASAPDRETVKLVAAGGDKPMAIFEPTLTEALLPDARRDQSGQDSNAVRLPCEAGGSAACMGLAVVHLKANGTAIIGMVLARRKRRAPKAH